ncbi:WD40 repeat-like protein [Linnemannia elongata AG-77]|uniref:WD40 repeat-like protein n=1 Tax=Linnemannia elongata AG-77 TaxID=1314771 RepID=A0A197JBJ0_9FUNG|nr:WD40 repeat-like protein [Linnemannia elongata AG-77]
MIEQSKFIKAIRKAAANAITILVRAGVRFNGADLKGIQIPRADLSGGQFDSAQLEGADLRKANLRNTWICQADFSKAQMAGVQFGEWPYLQESSEVLCCSYSPNGKTCVFGLADGTISVYDTMTWTKTHTLQGHTGGVLSVAYSPSGHQIASGSEDKTVRLWDTQTGAPGLVLSGHTSYVMSVAYSPSGHQIASGSKDNTVRLWDANSGRCLVVVNDFHGPINSIAWNATPDDTYLVTGCGDTSVRLWQITEEEGIFQSLLQWSSAHVRLVVSGASMEDVRGLSRVNVRLLQQSGAVGDPKPAITLQIAGKTISTVVSAASKFKQLRNSKMITGSSTVNSPVQQLDV